ncbi:MAG: efflux RND transporter permease subunit, partial [Proteobacteria bacterium]|nr:efflux RND transporter permease subunit [Pseudomonadota bacterium]
MIVGIVRNSIKYAGVVVTLAITVISYGLYTISNANLDVFPEFSPSQVVLQIEAQGYSSELVEKLVTQPIENALMGIPELANIRSQSIPGLSVVTVIFKDGSDVYLNRQVVGERIAALAIEMPRGVDAPTMTPLTSSASTVLGIGVTSDKRSLSELRTIVDWTIRPHLLAVPGVAEVNVFGGDVEQWQIQVDLQKLEQANVSFQHLIDAAKSATGMVGTGFIKTPNQHVNIQMDGQPRDLGDLEHLIVESRAGVNIHLGDLTKVIAGPAPSIGAASIDAQPGVFLMIQGQLGANTYAVTQDLERAILELEPLIKREEITLHKNLFRPANFIETAVENVQRDVLIGSVLVIGILFLFLYNVRTAIICAVAMPVSLLSAVIVLDALDVA